VLLAPEDSTESLIEKINNKLRVENGAGILSIKPNDGEEIPLNAGDSPFTVWSRYAFLGEFGVCSLNGRGLRYGANGCQVWFRPRDEDGGAGGKQWDNFDDFGFGGAAVVFCFALFFFVEKKRQDCA
jgi:hypothetical protein